MRASCGQDAGAQAQGTEKEGREDGSPRVRAGEPSVVFAPGLGLEGLEAALGQLEGGF